MTPEICSGRNDLMVSKSSSRTIGRPSASSKVKWYLGRWVSLILKGPWRRLLAFNSSRGPIICSTGCTNVDRGIPVFSKMTSMRNDVSFGAFICSNQLKSSGSGVWLPEETSAKWNASGIITAARAETARERLPVCLRVAKVRVLRIAGGRPGLLIPRNWSGFAHIHRYLPRKSDGTLISLVLPNCEGNFKEKYFTQKPSPECKSFCFKITKLRNPFHVQLCFS